MTRTVNGAGREVTRVDGSSVGPWPRKAVRAATAWSTSVLAWPAAIFLTIAVFMCLDVAADVRSGYSSWHIVMEVIALVLALAGVARTAGKLWRMSRQTRQLRLVLAGTQADLVRWREEAQTLLRGLGAAIDSQLREWSLSGAEQEVAWLILRGLSYREIAAVRSTTERTVRHQAIAVFHKAGLAGRAEMAAFFLEDLLDARRAPPGPTGPRPEEEPTALVGDVA